MSAEEPNVPYGGTTGERLKAFALNEDSRERLSAGWARYWELSAYAFLGVFAAVLRFWNLGERAMHHDESLHGVYSYGFSKGLSQFFTFGTNNHDTYKHVPFMHGPFQFIGNGFMMWIFQDGEFQSRILAATMGTAMVLMPFLFRKQLGTVGALAAALFITVSPTLMYYSRFTREDIYTAFWTFGLVIFMWRYIATRENKFLYLTAGFLAGSFLTKETTFMTAAAFIVFMDFLFATHLAEKIRATADDMTDGRYAALVIGLLPVAWLIAIAWPFIEDWRSKYELDELPPEANLIIVMGTLSLPMYAAAVQMLPGFGDTWKDRAGETGDFHVADAEFKVAVVSVLGLIGFSAALGIMWRPRTWAIAAACFWVPFVLLFTTFGSNYHMSDVGGMSMYNPFPGLFSGAWGSLDYWMSQQCVRRGNQPDYYYFVTIPVYEFVPLALSGAAALYYAIRGKILNAVAIGAGAAAIFTLLYLPTGPGVLGSSNCQDDPHGVSIVHVFLPFTVVLIGLFAFPMDRLNRFLLFWAVVTAFALTVAGEKMPWLNVHIALPLAVVAGRFVGQMLEESDLRDDLPPLERLAPYLFAGIAAALSITVFIRVGPFTPASAGGWLLAAVAASAVYWAYSGYSRRTAMQVALLGAVAAFSVFSLRAGILASWGHPNSPYKSDLAKRDWGETPDELLVYTQTSGDIPVLRDLVEKYARETGKGLDVPVVVDSADGFTWPWAWYLRDYKKVTYTSIGANYQPPQGAIVFATKGSANNVQTGGNYQEPVNYAHRRWFPEDYRGADGKYSTHEFFADLFSPGDLKNWLNFWVKRTPPSEIGHVDAVAFFPKDASAIPRAPIGPTVRTDGTQLVIGGNGSAPGQLSGPSDVALDGSGNIYVADTNNNRIQKYDPSGEFLAVAGGFTSDVSMNQPWSMTVASDGTVFVADTWNHKIVKLDSGLKKVKEWGGGGQVEADGDPMKLFGPRKITLTASGNVLITDTGNNRVIEYTSDGEFVRQFGSKGSGDHLHFTEPASVVAGANGDMYVADFWNKRIVHLGNDLSSKGEIKVDTWGSTGVTDRPYMALLTDGRLLVTDPNPCPTAPQCTTAQNGTVLVFDAAGKLVTTYDVPKEGQAVLVRPVGIASDGTSVLVSDSAGNVVRKIPLIEITK